MTWWRRYRPHLTYCDGLILFGLVDRNCVGQCRTRMYLDVAAQLGAQGRDRSALSALRAAYRQTRRHR
jgi:hypothetical protein